jgi:hypothetical protein
MHATYTDPHGPLGEFGASLTLERAQAKRFGSAVVLSNSPDKTGRTKVRGDGGVKAGNLYRLDGRVEETGRKAEWELPLAAREVAVWEL